MCRRHLDASSFAPAAAQGHGRYTFAHLSRGEQLSSTLVAPKHTKVDHASHFRLRRGTVGLKAKGVFFRNSLQRSWRPSTYPFPFVSRPFAGMVQSAQCAWRAPAWNTPRSSTTRASTPVVVRQVELKGKRSTGLALDRRWHPRLLIGLHASLGTAHHSFSHEDVMMRMTRPSVPRGRACEIVPK